MDSRLARIRSQRLVSQLKKFNQSGLLHMLDLEKGRGAISFTNDKVATPVPLVPRGAFHTVSDLPLI